MRTIILSAGDMGGTVVETDAAVGDEVTITSTAGETVGRVLRYRVEADGSATYTGAAD